MDATTVHFCYQLGVRTWCNLKFLISWLCNEELKGVIYRIYYFLMSTFLKISFLRQLRTHEPYHPLELRYIQASLLHSVPSFSPHIHNIILCLKDTALMSFIARCFANFILPWFSQATKIEYQITVAYLCSIALTSSSASSKVQRN